MHNVYKSINPVRDALASFVICKCGSAGNMFPLMDGKELRPLNVIATL